MDSFFCKLGSECLVNNVSVCKSNCCIRSNDIGKRKEHGGRPIPNQFIWSFKAQQTVRTFQAGLNNSLSNSIFVSFPLPVSISSSYFPYPSRQHHPAFFPQTTFITSITSLFLTFTPFYPNSRIFLYQNTWRLQFTIMLHASYLHQCSKSNIVLMLPQADRTRREHLCRTASIRACLWMLTLKPSAARQTNKEGLFSTTVITTTRCILLVSLTNLPFNPLWSPLPFSTCLTSTNFIPQTISLRPLGTSTFLASMPGEARHWGTFLHLA